LVWKRGKEWKEKTWLFVCMSFSDRRRLLHRRRRQRRCQWW
jgi:hypothetical protein